VPPRLELDLDEKDEDNCTPLHVALLGGLPCDYSLIVSGHNGARAVCKY